MRGILIVDDSPTMRRMVMAALRELKDMRFFETASGLEAIERLALTPIDLITLDLNMPDMHGLEVLHFLRQHQAYRGLPVVVLTTKDSEQSRAAALAAGATAYLTKPFAPHQLRATVENLVAEQRSRA